MGLETRIRDVLFIRISRVERLIVLGETRLPESRSILVYFSTRGGGGSEEKKIENPVVVLWKLRLHRKNGSSVKWDSGSRGGMRDQLNRVQ